MTTEGTVTNIDAISGDEANSSHKLLHNGHLFILRDGKIFNAQGARVKQYLIVPFRPHLQVFTYRHRLCSLHAQLVSFSPSHRVIVVSKNGVTLLTLLAHFRNSVFLQQRSSLIYLYYLETVPTVPTVPCKIRMSILSFLSICPFLRHLVLDKMDNLDTIFFSKTITNNLYTTPDKIRPSPRVQLVINQWLGRCQLVVTTTSKQRHTHL